MRHEDREVALADVKLDAGERVFELRREVCCVLEALLALDGQQDAARMQWDLAAANFPDDRAGIVQILDNVASREPNATGLAAYAKMQGTKEIK